MASPAFDDQSILANPFLGYALNGAFDEMFESNRRSRTHYKALYDLLRELPADEMRRKKQAADVSFLHQGITFTVYIPCRYVSGYLFHRAGDKARSPEGATHAWVEAFLPQLGWIGLDPTNNAVVQDPHIRTAVGRDYADVPPTKGVFNGSAESQLFVAVRVSRSETPPPPETDQAFSSDWTTSAGDPAEPDLAAQQQQQQ